MTQTRLNPNLMAAGTIFPFWVESNHDKKGYVELPYTLPQDFLLYILIAAKKYRHLEKESLIGLSNRAAWLFL